MPCPFSRTVNLITQERGMRSEMKGECRKDVGLPEKQRVELIIDSPTGITEMCRVNNSSGRCMDRTPENWNAASDIVVHATPSF